MFYFLWSSISSAQFLKIENVEIKNSTEIEIKVKVVLDEHGFTDILKDVRLTKSMFMVKSAVKVLIEFRSIYTHVYEFVHILTKFTGSKV